MTDTKNDESIRKKGNFSVVLVLRTSATDPRGAATNINDEMLAKVPIWVTGLLRVKVIADNKNPINNEILMIIDFCKF